MHTLVILFGWPNGTSGQVWPNILAALLTSVPVWIISYLKLKKHQQKRADALHHQLTQQFSNLNKKIDK